jgi:homoprotocatechuate degradation regulator HpaR
MSPSRDAQSIKTESNAPEKGALREFDQSLPMSLLKAREAVMKKFVPHLREHGLSAQQWRVIRVLEQHKELELSELAEHCYILKPSLTRIVQNLESRELIQRKESLLDRRRSNVSLSDSGLALFKQIAPASAERYQFITERFGYGKLELLYQLLDELIDAVYEESDPDIADEG